MYMFLPSTVHPRNIIVAGGVCMIPDRLRQTVRMRLSLQSYQKYQSRAIEIKRVIKMGHSLNFNNKDTIFNAIFSMKMRPDPSKECPLSRVPFVFLLTYLHMIIE